MISEKIKAKARRLKELSERGEGGEKETAQRKYAEFLLKHNIKESEVDIKANIRKFRFKNDDDVFILQNTILSINPFTQIEFPSKNILIASLDDEDYLEVISKYRYFIKLYRKEKRLLEMSFFTKHSDFFRPDEYVMNKFRDKQKKMNEAVVQAKEDAEAINNKLNEGSKEKDDQLYNLKRMQVLLKLLSPADYQRTHRTDTSKKLNE